MTKIEKKEYDKKYYKKYRKRKLRRAKIYQKENKEKIRQRRHLYQKYNSKILTQQKRISKKARATKLWHRAKSRNKPNFQITKLWVERKLLRGHCEVTNIGFDYTKPKPHYNANPFAPSLSSGVSIILIAETM